MSYQLRNKLIKQDEQLLKETNGNSPLIIQRKQLQKDIDDFHVLDKHQDARAIQQIIERVQHMAMFNTKYDIGGVRSIVQSNKQCQSIVMSPVKSISPPPCSYRVS
jgi:ATP-dependent protease Clp ATPase subunit